MLSLLRVLLLTFVGMHWLGNHVAMADGGGGVWSYNRADHYGPDHWNLVDARCGGQHQSPIDLSPPFIRDAHLDDIRLNYSMLESAEMTNTGYTVQITVPEDTSNFTFEGGALPEGGDYRLAQLHFHVNSEHTFNGGLMYPLELHLVHINENADMVASKPETELAVIGVMFKESKQDNPFWEPIVQLAQNISHPDNHVTLPALNFTTAFPANLAYFTYSGSLTTPNCREAVTWHVLRDAVPISGSQLEVLRELMDKSHGGPGFDARPTQPLNDRVVRVHDIVYEVNSAPSLVSSSLVYLLSVGLAFVLLARTSGM